MSYSNWWSSYFINFDTDAHGRRVEEVPCLGDRLSVAEMMRLEEYWGQVYDEMTGWGGK